MNTSRHTCLQSPCVKCGSVRKPAIAKEQTEREASCLSSKDFKDAGLPFEAFLRYCQLGQAKQRQAEAMFHRLYSKKEATK